MGSGAGLQVRESKHDFSVTQPPDMSLYYGTPTQHHLILQNVNTDTADLLSKWSP